MASVYPGAFDAFSNPLPTDKRTNHAAQHGNVNDAVEAIQAVLGLSPAGGSATVSARIGVVEGGVLSRVSGPGSSTDNALVRFDGTDGKTVQTSGITVDDSGNVTTDLTVSKTTATHTITSSSGISSLSLNTVAGTAAAIRLRTGTSLRWVIQKTSLAESGANAGSNFEIVSLSDAGALVATPVAITRATGKVTLGAVGATGGLELGASGPRVMSGTGSPEGVVSAPVGSQWTDTAATTGAIQWIKASGTGNTGWVVQYGDTGWRECVTTDTAIFTNATFNAANPNAFMHIRRLGGVVFMRFYSGAGTFTTNYQTIITMPAGFRPTAYTTPAGVTAPSIQMFSAVTLPTLLGLYFQNASELRNGQGWGSGAAYHGATSWTGDDSAWPTSLPGIALT